LLKKLSVRRGNREQGTPEQGTPEQRTEKREQRRGNRETGNREQGTPEQGTPEQFQLSKYPQFLISDKEKCNCFETPFAKTLHLLVLKIGETTINRRFYLYSATPNYTTDFSVPS
jgi:hypothetical protein